MKRTLPKITLKDIKSFFLSAPKALKKRKIKQQRVLERLEETAYMAPLIAASLRQPKPFASTLLKTVAAFFIIALIWASWAELDEVTRAEGKVIPSSQIKMISHLEGGIIEDILVREGDIVEKGQPLLLIDNTVAAAHYEGGVTTYYAALASVERLKAQAYGHPYSVPAEVETAAPDIAKKEKARYETALQSLNNDRAIAEREVDQKRQELLELRTQVEELQKQYDLAVQEARLLAPMVEKGLSPKIDYLRLQRDVSDLKSRKESASLSIPKAEAALQQAQDKRAQVDVAFQNQALHELKDAEQKLTDSKDATTTGKDRLRRTEVRSPVRGAVKELLINTIGGVVQPGRDLIAIVPLEDTLLVEAQVRPSDVAFLRPGLPAIVKVTAYDYSLYGGLDAKLVEISADTIQDEKKQSFFRIRVRTDKNHLGADQKPLPIIPGMTTQVDILTGKRTVLHYLLNPLLRARDAALKER